MPPRRLLATAAIIIVLAVLLLYDAPTPLPLEPLPTPGASCDYRYERRGLGWESWDIVYNCQ